MDILYYEQYLTKVKAILKQVNELEDLVVQNADKYGNKKDIEYALKVSDFNSKTFNILTETYEMTLSKNR